GGRGRRVPPLIVTPGAVVGDTCSLLGSTDGLSWAGSWSRWRKSWSPDGLRSSRSLALRGPTAVTDTACQLGGVVSVTPAPPTVWGGHDSERAATTTSVPLKVAWAAIEQTRPRFQ